MKNKQDWVLYGVIIWIACAAGYIIYTAMHLIR